ncbi:MAG: 16S rRNA (guanine(527)-N(7))-methyltransferase RsmG [Candidatus Eremiobacter antarcticus]
MRGGESRGRGSRSLSAQAPDDEALQILRSGLQAILGAAPEGAAESIERFCRQLLSANAVTNLTGATDLRQAILQVLDSLAPLPLIKLRPLVVDLGSGAGLPGIPAAIVFPNVRFALVEPRTKRVGFLRAVASDLSLGNVEVVKGSAPRVRFSGDRTPATVLARALASPPRAIELGLSLLKVGGLLLLYAGRAAQPDAESLKAAQQYGGSAIDVRALEVPHLFKSRHAWILRRVVDGLH